MAVARNWLNIIDKIIDEKKRALAESRDVDLEQFRGDLEALLDDFGHGSLLDVQWLTPQLASLGAVEIGRADYLAQLRAARRG